LDSWSFIAIVLANCSYFVLCYRQMISESRILYRN